MSRHDPTLTLRQIVEFAGEVADLVSDRSRLDLQHNREFRRALERCIELIGEAVTRLGDDWRALHPQVPWRQIIAMRNVLIHGYDIVIEEVLWDVATRDVPGLRKEINAMLEGSTKS